MTEQPAFGVPGEQDDGSRHASDQQAEVLADAERERRG
jgi:hypothetical protein